MAELERLRARVAQLESLEVQHRSTEGALRESEQLYRRLVETSPDSIMLTEPSGRILMANRRAALLHGYEDPAEMAGLNVLDFVPEEDHARARGQIDQIIREGEIHEQEYVLLRKDGSSYISELTGALIRDTAGEAKYIIYSGRDMTARVRLNRELVEAQKLESIGRLAGGIAHDFNNLLAVILGNASLQLRNRALPPKTIDCLKDIVEAAERASALTTQLLAYARGGLRRAVVSELNKLTQAACDIMRPTLPKQVQLRTELKEDLPPITVDRSQIQQVIINLCMNAIQASPAPGEVVVTTSIDTLDASRAAALGVEPGRYVVFRVRDEGTGMDSSTLERACEPFFTTKPESRGMGLPASLGIVQAHKGRLLIASKPGQGTVATVWLPVTGATADCGQCRPGADETAVVANAPQGHETILIIDPDPAVSHTAKQILASLGYCVVTKADADEGLAFLKTNREDIDLALLNVSLATADGRNMAASMLGEGSDLPILLTSGYAQTNETGALIQAGAAGFIQKPFSLMSLAQAVRAVLDDPKRVKRAELPES